MGTPAVPAVSLVSCWSHGHLLPTEGVRTWLILSRQPQGSRAGAAAEGNSRNIMLRHLCWAYFPFTLKAVTGTQGIGALFPLLELQYQWYCHSLGWQQPASSWAIRMLPLGSAPNPLPGRGKLALGCCCAHVKWMKWIRGVYSRVFSNQIILFPLFSSATSS